MPRSSPLFRPPFHPIERRLHEVNLSCLTRPVRVQVCHLTLETGRPHAADVQVLERTKHGLCSQLLRRVQGSRQLPPPKIQELVFEESC